MLKIDQTTSSKPTAVCLRPARFGGKDIGNATITITITGTVDGDSEASGGGRRSERSPRHKHIKIKDSHINVQLYRWRQTTCHRETSIKSDPKWKPRFSLGNAIGIAGQAHFGRRVITDARKAPPSQA
ncbi:hypothetical protein [Rhizobium leguminosarum]|uniref:hypothetical protein n=1 Tax=Rhizobium leguminosarum TaxID=384 RepID=UPI001AE39783|nr:hypothetical protein [Rhizobium leguminosarum]MBP2444237.1 hypothetical protein [Rhizobium leguminosarum]